MAAVLGSVVGAFQFAPRPAPPPVVRTIIPAATFVSGTDRNFAFTPDGSRLAYVSSDARQILVRPLDALEPVPILTTAAYLRGLFPSPDGQWFAYVENNFTLRKISAAGGPPTTVVVMDGPSREPRGDRTAPSCSAPAPPTPASSALRPAAGRSPS